MDKRRESKASDGQLRQQGRAVIIGTSHPETKPWLVEKIISCHPKRVLDVGAGAGNWLDALKAAGYDGAIDAVEIWKPYIDEYDLVSRYNVVHLTDIRDWDGEQFAEYDVVIFGDVLEHMTKDEAIRVWNAASAARHTAIAIPIVTYAQGPLHDNPYEEHIKADWDHNEVLDTFIGIEESQPFTITGAYWR